MNRLWQHIWFPRLHRARRRADLFRDQATALRNGLRQAEADRHRAGELLQNRHDKVVELHVTIRELEAENASLLQALNALTKDRAGVPS